MGEFLKSKSTGFSLNDNYLRQMKSDLLDIPISNIFSGKKKLLIFFDIGREMEYELKQNEDGEETVEG